MIRSNICNYSDLYIFVEGTVAVTNTAGTTVNNTKN